MSDPYRTPGRVDDPPDTWRCAMCKGCYHIAANARRVGGKAVCMSCYEKETAR